MTSHNPSGYYGLEMPEAIALEITALNYSDTAELIADVAYSLTNSADETMSSDPISGKANDCIWLMTLSQKNSLLRRLCELLETKFN